MAARLVFALLLAMHLSPFAFAQDDPAARRKAAERYAEVSDMRKMMADMARGIAQTLPEAEREDFQRLMVQHVRFEVVRETILSALQKHFTTRELDAMADFYGSPEGRSILQKIGPYMGDVMPGMQTEALRATQEFRRSLRKPKPAGT